MLIDQPDSAEVEAAKQAAFAADITANLPEGAEQLGFSSMFICDGCQHTWIEDWQPPAAGRA